MIGRSVGTSLTRLPLYARLPFRPAAHPCTLIIPSRSYATPGRPRSTVGEPSRPIKRAVKRAAKTPSTGDAASKKTAAKKKTAAAKKKKAAPAKERRAPLTPEQKEAKLAAKKARTEKERIKELQKIALDPPKHSPLTAYNVFTSEKLKENSREGSDRQPSEYREAFKAVSKSWADRTPADLEHYNHLAHTQNEAAQAAFKRWVESHTVEQIEAANRARAFLRRKFGERVKGTSKYSAIHDERHVKRPMTAYIQFSVNRQASGDFANIKMPDRAKLIGAEWKALSEGEKEKYKNLGAAEKSRYSEEYTGVHGHVPPYMNGGQAQAAAAAA